MALVEELIIMKPPLGRFCLRSSHTTNNEMRELNVVPRCEGNLTYLYTTNRPVRIIIIVRTDEGAV